MHGQFGKFKAVGAIIVIASLMTACAVKDDARMFVYPKWMMMCKDLQPILLSDAGIEALPRADKEKIVVNNEINDFYCMWD